MGLLQFFLETMVSKMTIVEELFLTHLCTVVWPFNKLRHSQQHLVLKTLKVLTSPRL
jgi:hypothetical protein